MKRQEPADDWQNKARTGAENGTRLTQTESREVRVTQLRGMKRPFAL